MALFPTRRIAFVCFRTVSLLSIALLLTADFSTIQLFCNAMVMNDGRFFIGFDYGTSGVRISVAGCGKCVDGNEMDNESIDQPPLIEVYSDSLKWKDEATSANDSNEWMNALHTLLSRVPKDILESTESICMSGTSASCVLVDRSTGKVTRGGKARMYNYDVITSPIDQGQTSLYGEKAIQCLEKYAPPKHTAKARTSSLSKFLSWHFEADLNETDEVLAHQADFLLLHASTYGLRDVKEYTITSDWHNCLKLGYDIKNLCWPSWLVNCIEECGLSMSALPSNILSPGAEATYISPIFAEEIGLPRDTKVIAATTDSNAAFFAAAGTRPNFGTAVTSLGSTLAMKVLSETYIEDSSLGVYSHRFPVFDGLDSKKAWLVGGASNSGCAVFRQKGFSNEEITKLSEDIDPFKRSPLNYYPLTKTGERFPFADSNKKPVLEPVPEDRGEYLHGILQAISEIELKGFSVLGELGMRPFLPTFVLTCGGGANNLTWQMMRENMLTALSKERGYQTIEVRKADKIEASWGVAILAAATRLKRSSQ